MRSVGQHMVDDHEKINRLLRSSASMLKAGAPELARSLLQSFDEELRHHIDLEVSRIFEPFVRATGDPEQAVADMQRQHCRILTRLDALVGKMGNPDGDVVETLAEMETLEGIIQQHMDFELRTLYAFASKLAASRREED